MKLTISAVLVTLLFPLLAPASEARSRLPTEVRRALKSPDRVTLYSLHPDPTGFHWFSRRFHDYSILGRLPIRTERDRKLIVSEVEHAANTYIADTKCIFQPRHGVRIVSGERTFDFLICYECLQMEVMSGEKRVAQLSIGGSPEPMNALLRAAHIRIAK